MKRKFKIIIDIALAIILFLLMLHSRIGILTHEILGISLIILFIIHHVINKNFYKNIFRSKYNKLRIIYIIIDTLMFIMMLIMVVSTFMISQKLFISLGFGNDYLGRTLHIISSYSLYILCGLHLGLHYNSIIKLKKDNKIFLNIFLIIIACVFGINGFIKRNFINKLSLKILYPIYYDESMITWVIDYMSIFIMFLMIGYGIYNIAIIKRRSDNKNE